MISDFTSELRERLNLLDRETGGLLESRDECCGLTSAQCHTVLELSRSGKVSLVDLASRLGLDASTLSRTIQGLVLLGLVNRTINEKDRRYVDLALSEPGTEVAGRIEAINGGYFDKVLALIPADRRAALLESLDLLIAAIRGTNDETGCCRPGERP